jgi:hypothetical protein
MSFLPEKPAQPSGKTPRTFTSAHAVMQLEGKPANSSAHGFHFTLNQDIVPVRLQ